MGNRGVTIVEVTVAATILVALFFVAGLLAMGMGSLRAAQGEALASALLNQELSACLLLNYEDIPNLTFDGRAGTLPQKAGTASQFPPAPYPATTVVHTANGSPVTRVFTLEVSAGPATGRDGITPIEDVKAIRATIYWREKDVEKSISRYTAVSKLGGF